MRSLGVSFLCLLVALPVVGDQDGYLDITDGGGEIALGASVPGVLSIEDPAFVVLADPRGNLVSAASPAGKGRVVAFSHGGFLKSEALPGQPAAASLVQNAIRWAGRSQKPKIGVHPGLPVLARNFEEAGFTVEKAPPAEAIAKGIAAYCVVAQRGFPDADIEALERFVAGGGGVLVAATPWAFAGNYPDFSQFPSNRILGTSGIQMRPGGYANREAPLRVGGLYSKDDSGAIHASAVNAAKRLAETRGELPAAERDRLIADLSTGMLLRGADQARFLEALEKLSRTVGPIIPNQKAPVEPGKDPLIDAVIANEDALNQVLAAGRMYPIPAAADYPGAVPDKAERVTNSLSIDGNFKGWLSGRGAGAWNAKELRPTGLYAPPGEVIRATVPEEIVGAGFEVIIGAYGGGLSNRKKWVRYPRLQRSVPIDAAVTEISNAFGGLINIRVPQDSKRGTIPIEIAGAVRAPLYEHGKTDVAEWKESIRHFPGPWAELASERMILALPSEYIRELENPDEVMEVWNGIIDQSAELVQVDRDDYRAERLVFDRQTAAGSMHSGYPVAAHTGGAAEKAVDATKLKTEGDWGFFHEYGHNHQHNLWALPGTGETTCNLWSVYLFEEFIGKPRDDTHGAIRPFNRLQRRNAYFKNGRKFKEEWSVWTALDTYLLIQEEFGWEPFKLVFDEYNRLPKEEWPKGQQQINDQWVVRLSRACGKNLAPYWAAWNLPMSGWVTEELDDLPIWDDHPVKKYRE